MNKNSFWGAVEKGVEKSLSHNEGKLRNALRDITIATSSIAYSLEYLPTFLAQNDNPRVCLNYIYHTGYSFSLNYYRNNALEKDVPRIQNVLNIGYSLYKMEQYFEKGIKKDFYAEQMKKGLEMMLLESKALLKEEIIRWNLPEYLINVQDKKGYLEGVLDIKGKKRRVGDLAQFLLDFLQSSF